MTDTLLNTTLNPNKIKINKHLNFLFSGLNPSDGLKFNVIPAGPFLVDIYGKYAPLTGGRFFTNYDGLNNLGRRSSNERFSYIIFKLVEWFLTRRPLKL